MTRRPPFEKEDPSDSGALRDKQQTPIGATNWREKVSLINHQCEFCESFSRELNVSRRMAEKHPLPVTPNLRAASDALRPNITEP